MANSLIRVAKSGNDWTMNDVEAFHIELHRQDPTAFFGVHPLPPPGVDPELINTLEARDMVKDQHAELIALLDLAMAHRIGEPAVVDFAVELFKTLGYVKRLRVARTGKEISLVICGERRVVRCDACIINEDGDIVLLFQEDRSMEEGVSGNVGNARPQLIAQAIALFTQINWRRKMAGLEPFTEKVIPGITMAGSVPTFFQIPVSEELASHVCHGLYPPQATKVTYYPSSLPRRFREGMKSIENRRHILSCFEAFKPIVGL
ncbi:hypothetical protein VNI00_011228 [Paramarasmius palmivorus]|uniref:Uncharacterized protein n=1 Tax=Paramarasmius palmivorus TaxID=297713 RepID=A0AAW0CGZ3_9AGAR